MQDLNALLCEALLAEAQQLLGQHFSDGRVGAAEARVEAAAARDLQASHAALDTVREEAATVGRQLLPLRSPAALATLLQAELLYPARIPIGGGASAASATDVTFLNAVKFLASKALGELVVEVIPRGTTKQNNPHGLKYTGDKRYFFKFVDFRQMVALATDKREALADIALKLAPFRLNYADYTERMTVRHHPECPAPPYFTRTLAKSEIRTLGLEP